MKKAVVLLSGGLDSSTTLAIAKSEGYELYAISFDYGQRHRIELEAAARAAKSLGVRKHLVTQFNLRDIGGSALTDDIDVPKDSPSSAGGGLQSFGASDLIPVTYVPARNTIFLSFAIGWAEVLGASDIFIGANAVDYSGYPDCRPEYLKAFEDMANLATKASVEGKLKFTIHSPLLRLSKSDIIKTGTALGLDYALTWSCYDPQEIRSEVRKYGSAEEINGTHPASDLSGFRSIVPCGRCDSCIFRKKGFEEAGLRDPLE
jgi:7-cyano-7-deazaguanine synthase